LDFCALNLMSYSLAKMSQIDSNLRIADGVGHSSMMSSDYASAPT